MKEKFTKGGWEVESYQAQYWVISSEDGHNKSVAIVTAYGESDNSIRDANAHLIAAAPKMYAMLERVKEIAEVEGFGVVRGEVIKLLAEARGE